ncbi:MAG: hypothetical protein GF317_11625 [Candidatus Lokiarchaeota archaeon]|nr:hypothetical protein [Candidatus Lokiarchaeota archaeon]MBD3200301.1 hypothetical protein [Candidatus Lokiarchaeota archaeon]
MENKKWIAICIIGGIFMIIGSTVGSVSFFATIFGIASGLAPELQPIFNIVLTVFTYIALGGGVSVIIGAIIVALDHYGIGKFIITLGAGMGLIGLIIYIITGIYGGTLTNDLIAILINLLTLSGGFGFLGIILTILGRFKLKKED